MPPMQPMQPMAQGHWEAQLQLLKMQMSTQQLANLAAAQQQQGAMRNNNQSAGFNMAHAAQAQAANNSINLPMGGGNDMTAVLAAMMNSGANPAAVMAYQQQLAQVAMFNQMNVMGNANNTLMAGNMNHINNTSHGGNGSNNNLEGNGHATKNDSGTSLSTICSEKSGKRKGEGSMKRKSGGLDGSFNSSFTRAQRIGLKNSLAQRRPSRNLINADVHNSLNSTLKNSLMSIESLTLDDIDSTGFDGAKMEGVFENSGNTAMK